MSDIYNRIRIRREELGLSQEELAARMSYKSKSSINKIEMGVNDIPQSKVLAFAKALETTTAYLMGVDESKERTDSNEAPAISDADIRAAFFDGADPTLTEEEMAAMWEDAKAYLHFKIEQRKKQRNEQ